MEPFDAIFKTPTTPDCRIHLDELCSIFGAPWAVLFLVERSDKVPVFRRVASSGLHPFSGKQYHDLHVGELGDLPHVLSGAESESFAPGLDALLVLPIPGVALCPAPERLNYMGVAAIVLLPLRQDCLDTASNTCTPVICTCLGVTLALWDRRRALERLTYRSNGLDLINLNSRQLGESILRVMRHAVPFYSGVMYLRDLSPGKDRYLVYAAALDENPNAPLKSYWAQVDEGATWRVMRGMRPMFGSFPDVATIGGRSTNTDSFALPDGCAVHEAWAVVPLIFNNEPVGVLHLEGVNEGQGVSRDDVEMISLLSHQLGSEIGLWRSGLRSERKKPDVSLVQHFHQLICGSPVRERQQDRVHFEDLIRSAFIDCDEVEDVKGLWTRQQRHLGNPLVPDIVLRVGGKHTVIIEVHLKDNPEVCKGVDEKFTQLMKYLNWDPDALGLLAIGGMYGRGALHPGGTARIRVLDRSRLERLCALSVEDRSQLLTSWATETAPGTQFASVIPKHD